MGSKGLSNRKGYGARKPRAGVVLARAAKDTVTRAYVNAEAPVSIGREHARAGCVSFVRILKINLHFLTPHFHRLSSHCFASKKTYTCSKKAPPNLSHTRDEQTHKSGGGGAGR